MCMKWRRPNFCVDFTTVTMKSRKLLFFFFFCWTGESCSLLDQWMQITHGPDGVAFHCLTGHWSVLPCGQSMLSCSHPFAWVYTKILLLLMQKYHPMDVSVHLGIHWVIVLHINKIIDVHEMIIFVWISQLYMNLCSHRCGTRHCREYRDCWWPSDSYECKHGQPVEMNSKILLTQYMWNWMECNQPQTRK